MFSLSATIDGDNVNIVQMNTIGNVCYIAYIDSASNLKVKAKPRNYIETSTTFGTSASSNSDLYNPLNNSNLIAWFDQSDSSSLTESLGVVSQITDKSTNAYELSQSVGVQRPNINSQLNSLNVFDYDGNDALTGNLTIPSSGNVSFHSLFQIPSGGVNNTGDAIFSVSGATNYFELIANNASAFDGQLNATGICTDFTLTNGPYNDDTSHVLGVVCDFDSSTLTVFVDGVQVGQATDYTTKIDTSTQLIIAANTALTQAVELFQAEFIITEDVDETNRQILEGYITHRYGITSILPTSHPYKNRSPRL